MSNETAFYDKKDVCMPKDLETKIDRLVGLSTDLSNLENILNQRIKSLSKIIELTAIYKNLDGKLCPESVRGKMDLFFREMTQSDSVMSKNEDLITRKYSDVKPGIKDSSARLMKNFLDKLTKINNTVLNNNQAAQRSIKYQGISSKQLKDEFEAFSHKVNYFLENFMELSIHEILSTIIKKVRLLFKNEINRSRALFAKEDLTPFIFLQSLVPRRDSTPSAHFRNKFSPEVERKANQIKSNKDYLKSQSSDVPSRNPSDLVNSMVLKKPPQKIFLEEIKITRKQSLAESMPVHAPVINRIAHKDIKNLYKVIDGLCFDSWIRMRPEKDLTNEKASDKADKLLKDLLTRNNHIKRSQTEYIDFYKKRFPGKMSTLTEDTKGFILEKGIKSVNSPNKSANYSREHVLGAKDPANSTREPTNSVREPSNSTREPTKNTRDPTYNAREPANNTRDPANNTRDPANNTRESIHYTREPPHMAIPNQKIFHVRVKTLSSPETEIKEKLISLSESSNPKFIKPNRNISPFRLERRPLHLAKIDSIVLNCSSSGRCDKNKDDSKSISIKNYNSKFPFVYSKEETLLNKFGVINLDDLLYKKPLVVNKEATEFANFTKTGSSLLTPIMK